MGLMMSWMVRGKQGEDSRNAAPHATPTTQAEIDELREELRLPRARQTELFSRASRT
ncbi:hypothetical protein ACFY3M_25840 [Streptomyces mirabilis]|uniref:hypothetical protein n=1 Tax=Streptomyces mirabilis TaxID=68239 RepID=UPI00367E6DA3